jgi:hypothetical protein
MAGSPLSVIVCTLRHLLKDYSGISVEIFQTVQISEETFKRISSHYCISLGLIQQERSDQTRDAEVEDTSQN